MTPETALVLARVALAALLAPPLPVRLGAVTALHSLLSRALVLPSAVSVILLSRLSSRVLTGMLC
jgi:hypothetical protein